MATANTEAPLYTVTRSAVDQTLQQVSLELNPEAGHRLSADVAGTNRDGHTVISVINIDTREHWHLIVKPLPLAHS